MTPAETNTYIQGFIALERDRRAKRWWAAMQYLAVAALILAGTGTVTLTIDPRPTTHATRFVVDLANCPERHHDEPAVVSFVVTLKADGRAESYRCIAWPRPKKKV